jgi:hypothetical protein
VADRAVKPEGSSISTKHIRLDIQAVNYSISLLAVMNDTSSSWFAGDFAERSTIVWEQMVASYSLWSVALPLVLIMYALSLLNVRFRAPTAPLIGLSSAFETRYTANWRFFRNAAAVLDEGFSKVW